MYRVIYLLFITILMGGCGYVVPTVKDRVATLQSLTKDKNLKKEIIKTKEFDIYSFSKNSSTCRGKKMNLYIEGDGLSWIASDIISLNPTPINPMGLKLFLQDSYSCTLYLARPCQYISSSTCKAKYWTSDRFSPKVIESFSEALDKIKRVSKVSAFRLLGYSGGGAIAALLAAKRDDVYELVTICGNLDIKEWTKEHYISPLYGSLNPANFSQKLSKIRQIHLIGGKDNIVGESIFKSYLKRFKNNNQIRYRIFKDFNHSCCWEKSWKLILKDLDK